MAQIKIQDLMEAGVHFGHQTKRWNPKMKPYIFGKRNGIHIFDLGKTMVALNEACKYLYKTVAEGGDILFVGTKRQAQDIIVETAERSNMFYISHRWLGGTLTNLTTIRKSVAKLERIQALEESGELDKMKKKESSRLRREMSKLNRDLRGVTEMKTLPAAIVVIDCVKEATAIKEAERLGIPVVAIVDSNANPDSVDYGVPGNDDAVRAIKVITEQLSAAVFAGKGIADQRAEEEKAKKAKEAAERKAAKEAEKKEREAKKAAAKTEEAPAKKAPAKKTAAKKAPAKKAAAKTEEASAEKAPAKKAPAKKATDKKADA